MATETKLNQLVINKLTREQYKEAKDAGQINPNELYMVTDDVGDVFTVENEVINGSQNPVSGGAVYDAIAAIPVPDVSLQIDQHDTNTSAHADIRQAVSEIGDELASHSHDDLYYTEAEIDSKLSDKSDTGHTHTASQVGAAPSTHATQHALGGSDPITPDMIGIEHMLYVGNEEPVGAKVGDVWVDMDDEVFDGASVEEINATINNAVNDLTNTINNLTAADVGASPTNHTHTADEVGALPNSTVIPSKTSQLTNDSGFITGYTETDPTVPAWAKAASKPTYTKSEVGLANVDNVKQYSASNPPPYPVTKVNNKTGAVSLTYSDVGAAASSHGNHVPTTQTASNKVFLRNDNTWQTVTPANIGAATTTTYTVSVPYSGWAEQSNGSGGWQKSITVSGILAADNPVADVVLGTDTAANENYIAAWSTVQRIVTAANSITIYTNGDPKVAFSIQLKVVR